MVLKIRHVLLLFWLVFITTCATNKRLSHLTLIQAYEVDTYEGLEPSGLTKWGDSFYTVSDNHDYIYELQFENNKVKLKPYILIQNEQNERLDFEGITHDGSYFYLISENKLKVLSVSKDGLQQKWINLKPSLETIAKKAGLFQTDNAYFEGICVYRKHSKLNFIMVAERQPRGFIRFSLNKKYELSSYSAYKTKQRNYLSFNDSTADFSGLSCHHDNEFYVLNRNAYTVVKLNSIKGKFIETFGWSYKDIVMQAPYMFEDMEYGHAEGLYVDEDKVYLILDNNNTKRKDERYKSNSLFLELSK